MSEARAQAQEQEQEQAEAERSEDLPELEGREDSSETTGEMDAPESTLRYMSWSAIKFIKAPSVRAFQWAVVLVMTALFAAVLLSLFIEMDVSIETTGEVRNSSGVREVMVPIEGILDKVIPATGEEVKEGQVIAKLVTDRVSEGDIDQLINGLTSALNAAKTVAVKSLKKVEPPTLGPGLIYDRTVTQSLADVDQAAKQLNEQVDRLARGLSQETQPIQKRVNLLQEKLNQLSKSRQKRLLQSFKESTEEEIGRLQSQIATLVNQEGLKLSSRVAELVRALQLAISSLENYIREHQIRAPISGTVAKINVGNQSQVSSGRSVATIIPAGARLIGAIQVRSRDIVRVRKDQTVLYKMEAYPYQHYGLFTGAVSEFDLVQNYSTGSSPDDFLVEATIAPPDKLDPTLQAKLKLVIGTRFTANIVVERKTLFRLFEEKLFGRF